VTRNATVLALLILASCSPGDGRSPEARSSLAAVEETRGLVAELSARAEELSNLRERLIKARTDSSPEAETLAREGMELHGRVTRLRDRMKARVRSVQADLETKISLAPKDPGLKEARSLLREAMGDSEAALEDLEEASKGLPGDPSIAARRAGLLRKLGRYEEARAACADLLKSDPTHAVALATDGLALYCLNDFEKAEARLQEAAGRKGRLEPSLAAEVERTLEQAKAARPLWAEELKKREAEAKADDLPRVKLVTARGEIVVELFENEAPNAVANFIDLCSKNFYDGTTFHRVELNMMAQGGDPLSRNKDPDDDGTGGPGYTFRDELGPGYRRHFRGSLSLAHRGKDTNGSQFFLTHRPLDHLDGIHGVFGRVIQGMDVVDKIRKGDVLTRTEILRTRPHAYRPTVE
jgi:cyclophilin family peptidyl-prolyl cis-trans isomerase